MIESEGSSRLYRYSRNLNFDQGFAEDLRDYAATDALEIRAFFTVDSEELMTTYLMQPNAIPEPRFFSLALIAAGSILLVRNRTGESGPRD